MCEPPQANLANDHYGEGNPPPTHSLTPSSTRTTNTHHTITMTTTQSVPADAAHERFTPHRTCITDVLSENRLPGSVRDGEDLRAVSQVLTGLPGACDEDCPY